MTHLIQAVDQLIQTHLPTPFAPIAHVQPGAIISSPHRHGVQKACEVIEETTTACCATGFGQFSGVALQLWNFGVFFALEAGIAEVILLKPTTELLKGPAADTENGETLCNCIIISNIDIWIEVPLILCCGFLIEP